MGENITFFVLFYSSLSGEATHSKLMDDRTNSTSSTEATTVADR